MLRGSKCYMWQHDAQCHGIGSRPGESCLRRASWWILCLSRGGFEGSSVGVLAWSSFVRRFEGSADGRSEAAQRWAWRCPVDPGSHSAGDDAAMPGTAAQWRRWPHRARGDGGDALRWPDVTAPSEAARGRWPYPFRGCHRLLSRGATWRKYGSGQNSVTE
jgi:hypothetical protein